jgi:hypothetical protein
MDCSFDAQLRMVEGTRRTRQPSAEAVFRVLRNYTEAFRESQRGVRFGRGGKNSNDEDDEDDETKREDNMYGTNEDE